MSRLTTITLDIITVGQRFLFRAILPYFFTNFFNYLPLTEDKSDSMI